MKFTAVLWDYRPTKDDCYPVKIRVADGVKAAVYITVPNLRVDRGHWNKASGEVYPDAPNAIEISRIISQELARVKDEYLKRLADGNKLSSRGVVDSVKADGDFYYYFQLDIDAARARGTESRADVNSQSLRVMKTWRKKWYVDDLNKKSIASLINFLRKKGNAHNTIVDKIGRIRTTVNRHLKKVVPDDLFEDVDFSLQKTKPKGLSGDEVQRIRELKLPAGKQMWHARNMYLLSLNFHGMRRGDLFRLRWSEVDTGRVQYKMHKTGHEMDVKITEESAEILALYPRSGEYVFPFLKGLSSEAAIYDRIKRVGKNMRTALIRIGKRAGTASVPNLHTARHTFTKKAKAAKVDPWTMKNMLGHKKITTTQIYSESLDNTEQDEATDAIFSDYKKAQ